MARPRTIYTCSECRQQVAQWVGRCPGCGAWGTIESAAGGDAGPASPVVLLGSSSAGDRTRVPTGIPGLDRVLGGGLVPASVVLLAGEPGIGKSTLLLHLLSRLSERGRGVPPRVR